MTRDEQISVLQAENAALQTTLAAARQTIQQQQEVIRRLEAHMAQLDQLPAQSHSFAAARRLWQQRRGHLLDAEGGAISAEQAAHTLNTTPDAIEKRRQEGVLLGLGDDSAGYVYPVWQFDGGKPIRGLSTVHQELQGIGPWMRAAFMLTGDAHLNGERPLDILRRGEIGAVAAAAREYGEQGGG